MNQTELEAIREMSDAPTIMLTILLVTIVIIGSFIGEQFEKH